MDTIGYVLGVIGVILTILSLIYAKHQSKMLSNAHRDEIISLWASLDRVRTLIFQTEKITDEDGFITNGTLNPNQLQMLPKIHKGLCDEYIRMAELIIKKSPNFSLKEVDELCERKVIQTDWQKQQFINLIIGSICTKPQ